MLSWPLKHLEAKPGSRLLGLAGRMQQGAHGGLAAGFYLCRTFGTSFSMVMRLGGPSAKQLENLEKSKSKERQCKSHPHSRLCSLFFFHVFSLFSSLFSSPICFPFSSVFSSPFSSPQLLVFPPFPVSFIHFLYLFPIFFTIFATFFFPTFINILSLLLPSILLCHLSDCVSEIYPHFHSCSAYLLLCSFNFLPNFSQQHKLGVFSHSKGPGAGRSSQNPTAQGSQGLRKGFPSKVPRSRFPSKVPRKRFPARFPGIGFQERFPGRGSQAKFLSKVPKPGSQRFPGRGCQARFPSKAPKVFQEQVSKDSQRFLMVPRQGSQAKFPSKVPKQDPQARFPSKFPKGAKGSRKQIVKQGSQAGFPRSSGRDSEARFPGTGFERFPKILNVSQEQVPKSRFPSKLPTQGFQG